jgi:glycyl-tRNA synthetase beta chain
MSLDFLLEIGTEEIPHWMIPGALKQLAAADCLGAEPRVDATPRRLVVQASGLPERTPDQEQVIKGPPVSAGDKAAAGFAKKQGVDLQAMQKAGDYYELHKVVPGRRAIDILAETLPGVILGIQWPKTMYWTAKDGPRFIRPIRWIVALLGDEVIPFEIAGVKSGNVTRGHRQLGSSSIPVTIANYESELRRNFVILSSHERRHKIEKEASALGAKIDADLLETLTFITEYPAAIRGEFDPKFLELPAEVLTTVMRHHQKYFSVESAAGALAPNFVAVMNTSGDPEGLVKRGNERVLKARFNDARFFWDVDQRKKLEDRFDDLAKVTFHARIGSYKGKAERMVDIVMNGLGGSLTAQRAAFLAKTDLTTEMVKEFTDLQGIVGGLYARAQGEDEAVARAIYEHYKPLSMEDEIPATHEGQLVALADKLDTLRECFRIGMVPTGSRDPFALRRAAQGVVKILVEAELDWPTLDRLSGTNVKDELYDFFLERIEHYFREVKGFKYDEVNAVLKAEGSPASLHQMHLRLQALAYVRPTEDFEPLAASFKRIANILKQAGLPDRSFDPALLEAGPEQELYREFERVRLQTQSPPSSYREELEAIAGLRPTIDKFFDKVLVNAPNPAIRANRLWLLLNLYKRFSTIARFSEIVTSGDQK